MEIKFTGKRDVCALKYLNYGDTFIVDDEVWLKTNEYRVHYQKEVEELCVRLSDGYALHRKCNEKVHKVEAKLEVDAFVEK